MSHGWRGGRAWDGGCARRIMKLIGSWGRRSSIVGGGRNGGGLGGRMGGVIRGVGIGRGAGH